MGHKRTTYDNAWPSFRIGSLRDHHASSADSNAQGEGFDVVDSVAWDKYLAATETDPDAEEPDLYDADEHLAAPESPESTMFFEQNQKSQAHVQDSEASQFFEGNDDDDDVQESEASQFFEGNDQDDKTDPVHDPEQNLQQWDQFDSENASDDVPDITDLENEEQWDALLGSTRSDSILKKHSEKIKNPVSDAHFGISMDSLH